MSRITRFSNKELKQLPGMDIRFLVWGGIFMGGFLASLLGHCGVIVNMWLYLILSLVCLFFPITFLLLKGKSKK